MQPQTDHGHCGTAFSRRCGLLACCGQALQSKCANVNSQGGFKKVACVHGSEHGCELCCGAQVQAGEARPVVALGDYVEVLVPSRYQNVSRAEPMVH